MVDEYSMNEQKKNATHQKRVADDPAWVNVAGRDTRSALSAAQIEQRAEAVLAGLVDGLEDDVCGRHGPGLGGGEGDGGVEGRAARCEDE